MENEDSGNYEVHQDSDTPVVIVIPGLTSDSDSVVSVTTLKSN